MRRTLRSLGATALASCLLCSPAAAETPITGITTKMTGVAEELAKAETGEPVQARQKAVVRDLDELIASLEKECQACRTASSETIPIAAWRTRSSAPGTGGIGSLVNPAESNKDWAKLSDRERDRILQSMSEGFPPEYRTVLERYYRRLAEEKTVPPAGTRASEGGGTASGPALIGGLLADCLQPSTEAGVILPSPPGEGGRDGRMRGTGPSKSHVLGREVDHRSRAPHPPLRGTFSRGEKGGGIRHRLVGNTMVTP